MADKLGNEKLGDPKCWICAKVTKPTKIYGPLRCVECLDKKNRGEGK